MTVRAMTIRKSHFSEIICREVSADGTTGVYKYVYYFTQGDQ